MDIYENIRKKLFEGAGMQFEEVVYSERINASNAYGAYYLGLNKVEVLNTGDNREDTATMLHELEHKLNPLASEGEVEENAQKTLEYLIKMEKDKVDCSYFNPVKNEY